MTHGGHGFAAPVARDRPATVVTAAASPSAGRVSRYVRYSVGSPVRRRIRAGSSAWTSDGTPSPRMIGKAEASSAGLTIGNSPTPESTRNDLNPQTPSSTSGPIWSSDPGMRPPQKATSTLSFPSAAARFSDKAPTLTVGGIELSGISTIVVVPPAAAALVAVPNPSHSDRPGSLTWTWESTSPGMTTRSPKSTSG